MSSFHEVRFPDNIAYGATGGPEFATTVVATGSGHEKRSTAAASVGLQLGAERYAQIIMFMTADALDRFRNSSGWQAGVNAKVTMIDQGKAADLSSIIADNPVIAFVFGQRGLMGDLSIEGSKITKLER